MNYEWNGQVRKLGRDKQINQDRINIVNSRKVRINKRRYSNGVHS